MGPNVAILPVVAKDHPISPRLGTLIYLKILVLGSRSAEGSFCVRYTSTVQIINSDYSSIHY